MGGVVVELEVNLSGHVALVSDREYSREEDIGVADDLSWGYNPKRQQDF